MWRVCSLALRGACASEAGFLPPRGAASYAEDVKTRESRASTPPRPRLVDHTEATAARAAKRTILEMLTGYEAMLKSALADYDRVDGDPYLNLRALSAYSGLGRSTLRAAIASPTDPLPHYRVAPGKILVRRSEFDVWAARRRRVGAPVEDRIMRRLQRERAARR
jgi:hypothetical protein